MIIGYIRVSTPEQNTARQDSLMAGLDAERIFTDRVSGAKKDRPGLNQMLEFVREGDTVVVESISRFARNTRDLLELTELLSRKGVEFVSKKEAIDTSTPTGKFMLTVFAAVAELERDFILQRQREGIAEAKREGKYKGRKPIEVDMDKFVRLYGIWKEGNITASAMRKELGLSSSTFYRRVRAYERTLRIQESAAR